MASVWLGEYKQYMLGRICGTAEFLAWNGKDRLLRVPYTAKLL